jgi:hypothetical protein
VVLSTQNDDVPATEILRVSANLHSHQSTIDSRTPPRASGAGTSEKLAARQRKQARILYHLLRRARSLSSTISHQEVSAVWKARETQEIHGRGKAVFDEGAHFRVLKMVVSSKGLVLLQFPSRSFRRRPFSLNHHILGDIDQ